MQVKSLIPMIATFQTHPQRRPSRPQRQGASVYFLFTSCQVQVSLHFPHGSRHAKTLRHTRLMASGSRLERDIHPQHISWLRSIIHEGAYKSGRTRCTSPAHTPNDMLQCPIETNDMSLVDG